MDRYKPSLAILCFLLCGGLLRSHASEDTTPLAARYPQLELIEAARDEQGKVIVRLDCQKPPFPFAVHQATQEDPYLVVSLPTFYTEVPSTIPVQGAVLKIAVREEEDGVRVFLPAADLELVEVKQVDNSLFVTLQPASRPAPERPGHRSNGDDHYDPASTYSVGPGDLLSIAVFGHDDLSRDSRVLPNGTINFPLVGIVDVAGLTPERIAEHLKEILGKDFVVEPHVLVGVSEYKSQSVNVIGEVKRPGKYALKGLTSIIDILSEAGGLTEKSGSLIVITRHDNSNGRRGDALQIQITKEALFSATDDEANVILMAGDIVRVPETAFFYIRGEVNRPGQYPLRPETTIQKAISLAGGFSQWADIKDVQILREGEGPGKKFKVNIRKIAKGQAPDLTIQPEDIIVVTRRLL